MFITDPDNKQSGLVSIMVASVLMVVMALITLGFTRAAQNEQRQAIDNQLSRQAFYAAESGINIAVSSPGFPGALKDDCDVSDYNNGEIIAGDTETVFTCLLINPTPKDLVFANDSITTNKAKVVPLRTSPQSTSFIFEWKDNRSSNVQSSCSNSNMDFDQNAFNWNKVSPLRLDLVGIPTGGFDRDELLTNQFSATLYPCDTGATVAYGSADGAELGRIVPADCDNAGDYECRIEITGLPSGVREYYARFSSIYGEINVRITGRDSSGDQSIFANAQAVVDSTGRAADVFRRLQARVPLYESYVLPNATLQTLNDICKVYEVQEDEVLDGC